MHDYCITEWDIEMITKAHQLRADKYLFLCHGSHVKVIPSTINLLPEKALCYYLLI